MIRSLMLAPQALSLDVPLPALEPLCLSRVSETQVTLASHFV
jgi:hypothetical protein